MVLGLLVDGVLDSDTSHSLLSTQLSEIKLLNYYPVSKSHSNNEASPAFTGTRYAGTQVRKCTMLVING